ncbi:hypothetical protein GCM10011588_34800 [Nocardia jinanensis]|uniref:HTH luxR-type domain-containing protein n=2 Tax=Nocardia jinanensis TaxID=382504 RepID=A0A917VTK5_9NOCA|nr:hypothetical protein GCM10011588_34800 [Nocardia jinanensis]
MLAAALCAASAAVTGADSVLLAEVTGMLLHEIARHDRTGSAPPGLRAEEITLPLPPAHEDRGMVRHEIGFAVPASRRAITVLEIEQAATRTVLLVEGTVGDEDHAAVLLLIDLAVATAERLDSEERLRAQQLRLRTLSEEIRGLHSAGADPALPHSDRAAEFAAAAALLTDRERDILENILQGASNAAIAQTHTLSIETVKTHVKHILRKMGAVNRAELIARSG